MAIEKKKIHFEDLISKWWFWVGAILVIVLIGAVFFGEYPDEKVKQEQQQAYQAEKKKKEEEDKKKAEQEKMDKLRWDLSGDCQEAVIYSQKLPKYIEVNTITSNTTINEMGYYDKSKQPIYIVSWDGKDKLTEERVLFRCYVSKNGDKANIHWLHSGDVTFVGWEGYPKYDENGKEI